VDITCWDAFDEEPSEGLAFQHETSRRSARSQGKASVADVPGGFAFGGPVAAERHTAWVELPAIKRCAGRISPDCEL